MKAPIDILISNDDGITSPGILALATVAREFGNITIVAPDSPQSGMGHAISVGTPLRLEKHQLTEDLTGWACSGTPVDCVKLATGVILHKKPDLVLSGINHGANASVSVFYSGTMSAAMEGTIEGIPSIGFSLDNFSWDANFLAAKNLIRKIIVKILHKPLPAGITLNVNIPNLPEDKIKGMKTTRMAIGRWVEQFDKRTDPHGRDYYWLAGKFFTEDTSEDTDIYAIRNGYVSLCPVLLDITSLQGQTVMNSWDFE